MSKITRAFTPANIHKGISLLKHKGPKALIKKVKSKLNSPNETYDIWFRSHKLSEEEYNRQKETTFDYMPLISIIVPVYHPEPFVLREMIESVKYQSYSNWQLCLADGGDINSKKGLQVNRILEAYEKQDSRISYYKLDKNEGISGNTNQAYKLAKGEYIALLDHDDMLASDCLFEVVSALNEEKYDIIYTDEDKIGTDSENHSDPQFKPDFSIDYLRTHNYITHFFVVNREVIGDGPFATQDGADSGDGPFDREYDGAQDYDFILRCVEETDHIYHIPKVLYHWRAGSVSTAGDPYAKSYTDEAGLKALKAHIERCGENAEVLESDMTNFYKVHYNVEDELLSIVIPNMDHIEELNRCITSIMNKSDYKNFEIIVVENNSFDDKTYSYYKGLKKKYSNIKVLNWSNKTDMAFNYASLINYGVKYASGDYLLFLHNDLELIEPSSIRRMLGMCKREDVGVVGSKLVGKDNTIQSAGVIISTEGNIGYAFAGLKKDDLGYMLRPNVNGNYSAVTNACMMVKKSLFEELSGYDEEFSSTLNDIDFCLRVREQGYSVAYCSESEWYHYEVGSRMNVKEKERILEDEREIFKARWIEEIEKGDPFYNKNLSQDKLFRL